MNTSVEKLRADVATLRAARDELFAVETSAEAEDLRTQIVAAKRAKKPTGDLAAKRAAMLAPRAAERAALKVKIRAAEQALASAERAASLAALRKHPTDKLEAEAASLRGDSRDAKVALQNIQVVLDERASAARIKGLAASLSPADRAALAQELKADGIPSAEAVGTPGK